MTFIFLNNLCGRVCCGFGAIILYYPEASYPPVAQMAGRHYLEAPLDVYPCTKLGARDRPVTLLGASERPPYATHCPHLTLLYNDHNQTRLLDWLSCIATGYLSP